MARRCSARGGEDHRPSTQLLPPRHAAAAAAAAAAVHRSPAARRRLRRQRCRRDGAARHGEAGTLGRCPAGAVRKRYLHLALRLHPDKAKHPQAPEAFTAIEAAWQKLRPAA